MRNGGLCLTEEIGRHKNIKTRRSTLITTKNALCFYVFLSKNARQKIFFEREPT